MIRLMLTIVVLLLLAAGPASCQTPTETAAPRATFRIGYIRQDPESVTTAGVFNRDELEAYVAAHPLDFERVA